MSGSFPVDDKAKANDVITPLTGGGQQIVHLKVVPRSLGLRRRVVEEAEKIAVSLDRDRPLVRHELESIGRSILDRLNLPSGYIGWAMVALGSAFWREQVAAVSFERRLLLLPRCLRDQSVCKATYDEEGLDCQACGACSLPDLKAEAEGLGYRVLIAEGSPTVMKIILGGKVDAVLGVACLDVLEKTLDKILLAGIPCMAVPLLGDGCQDTMVDLEAVRAMLETPHQAAKQTTRTFLHLMRCASGLFEPEQLDRLIPRREGSPGAAELDDIDPTTLDPILSTDAIARSYLAAGGKHSRPFITLAAYDAMTGGAGTSADGEQRTAELSDAVLQVALAVETFHKASLVHDDIEDDDPFRYERPTLHKKYGMATAINVGDYLIGIGYRLVAERSDAFPSEMVGDLLAQFAQSHTKLCEGQGAELIWRDTRDKQLTPLDALKIYALKTAPAFECALLAGIRMAGRVEPYRQAAVLFSRHLGIAYQILNDLDDWNDPHDGAMSGKRTQATDLLRGRPTVLWALALQQLEPEDREQLVQLAERGGTDLATIARAVELYTKADVFRTAATLVTKHHAKALEAAESIGEEPMVRLLHFLADAILDRRPLAITEY